MKTLIIFNREPYDTTDVTWNGLRLADKLVDAGSEVRIFLMNDAVDMARDACRPPEGYDQDLSQMLKALIARGVIGDYREPKIMRFGFTPLYTSFTEVWDAVEILGEILDGKTWDQPQFKVRHSVT